MEGATRRPAPVPTTEALKLPKTFTGPRDPQQRSAVQLRGPHGPRPLSPLTGLPGAWERTSSRNLPQFQTVTSRKPAQHWKGAPREPRHTPIGPTRPTGFLRKQMCPSPPGEHLSSSDSPLSPSLRAKATALHRDASHLSPSSTQSYERGHRSGYPAPDWQGPQSPPPGQLGPETRRRFPPSGIWLSRESKG